MCFWLLFCLLLGCELLSPVLTNLVAQENSWKYSSLKAYQHHLLPYSSRKGPLLKKQCPDGMGIVALKGTSRILSGKLLEWDNSPQKILPTNHNCHHHLLSWKIFTEHLSWVLLFAGYYFFFKKRVTFDKEVKVHGLSLPTRMSNPDVSAVVRLLDFRDWQLKGLTCLLDLVMVFL